MLIHNFQLSDEQDMIRDTVSKFVQDTVSPNALEHDEHRRFVRHSFDGLAELGVLGLPISEACGGAELGMLSFVVALEGLSKACGSSARLLLTHTGFCGKALDGLDSDLARQLVGRVASGEVLAGFVGPEHTIRASRRDGGFTLNGSAGMVTAATEAGALIVVAALDDGTPLLFFVEPARARVEATPALGFRASAPGMVTFDGTVVADDGLLAHGDAAQAALARVELCAGVGGGAIAVGLAVGAVEASRRHAGERVAFGKTLDKQQAVVHKLVQSWRLAKAARHMVYHAARLMDAGESAGQDARMARFTALEAAALAGDDGVQIHGGYGYTVEYHVERMYRDAQTLTVMDVGIEALLDRMW